MRKRVVFLAEPDDIDELERRRQKRSAESAQEKQSKPSSRRSAKKNVVSGSSPKQAREKVPTPTPPPELFDPNNPEALRAGKNVICKVVQTEPGGYAVKIARYNFDGFLPTSASFSPGQEILAQFVCLNAGRALLCLRVRDEGTESKRQLQHAGKQEELHNLLDFTPPVSAPPSLVPLPKRTFRLKRATDLLPILMPLDEVLTFKVAEYDLDSLIADIQLAQRTGVIKASSQSQLSRSAMLLYRGRVVGCLYSCKSMPNTQPTEQSMKMMLADLRHPQTQVKLYGLPEEISLAMASLFLGYPVQRDPALNAKQYMDYIRSWCMTNEHTACLSIILPRSASTCLGFISNGIYAGAFNVEDQMFVADEQFVYKLLKDDSRANVEASILPPRAEVTLDSLGFSLTEE